jgi:hypothetical protein
MVSTSTATSGWTARIVVVAASPPSPGRLRVHQDDIWPHGLGDLDGVLGVGRLTDDLNIVDPAKKGT